MKLDAKVTCIKSLSLFENSYFIFSCCKWTRQSQEAILISNPSHTRLSRTSLMPKYHNMKWSLVGPNFEKTKATNLMSHWNVSFPLSPQYTIVWLSEFLMVYLPMYLDKLANAGKFMISILLSAFYCSEFPFQNHNLWLSIYSCKLVVIQMTKTSFN